MSSLPEVTPAVIQPERQAPVREPRSDDGTRRSDDDFSRQLERERSASAEARERRQAERSQERDRAESERPRSEDRASTDASKRTDEAHASQRSSDDSKTETSPRSDDSSQIDGEGQASGENQDEIALPVEKPLPVDEAAILVTQNTDDLASLESKNQDEKPLPVDEAAILVTQNTDDLADFMTKAQTEPADTLIVTARSGDEIAMVPPKPSPTDGNAPGALGRWFVEAAGPTGIATQGSQNTGPSAQSAGLLNKLNSQTSGQANGQAAGEASTEGLPPSLNGQSSSNAGDESADGLPTQQQNTQAAKNLFAGDTLTKMTSFDDFLKMSGQTMNQPLGPIEPATATNMPTGAGQSIGAAGQATATVVPQTSTGQAVPVTALAVEITRQAANGKTQFDIRLDPPELGRLNVRLEVDGTGQTRTHLVVERSETLDMLMTDARNLERALQQAGLKTDPGSVTFELAGDQGEGLANQDHNATNDNQGNEPEASDTDGNHQSADGSDDTPAPEAIRQQLMMTGQLDVRV